MHPLAKKLHDTIKQEMLRFPPELQQDTMQFFEDFERHGIQHFWRAQPLLPLCQEWINYNAISILDAFCNCRLSTPDSELGFLSDLYTGLQDKSAQQLTPLVYTIYKKAANPGNRLSAKDYCLGYLWEYCLEHDPEEADTIARRINMWSIGVLQRAIQSVSEKILFQHPNPILHALQRPALYSDIQRRWTFQAMRHLFTAYRMEWPKEFESIYPRYATWQILLWREAPTERVLQDLLQNILPNSFDERMLSWICQTKIANSTTCNAQMYAIAKRYKPMKCQLYDTWIDSGLTNTQWIDAVGKQDIVPDKEHLWRWNAQAMAPLECSDLIES